MAQLVSSTPLLLLLLALCAPASPMGVALAADAARPLQRSNSSSPGAYMRASHMLEEHLHAHDEALLADLIALSNAVLAAPQQHAAASRRLLRYTPDLDVPAAREVVALALRGAGAASSYTPASIAWLQQILGGLKQLRPSSGFPFMRRVVVAALIQLRLRHDAAGSAWPQEMDQVAQAVLLRVSRWGPCKHECRHM